MYVPVRNIWIPLLDANDAASDSFKIKCPHSSNLYQEHNRYCSLSPVNDVLLIYVCVLPQQKDQDYLEKLNGDLQKLEDSLQEERMEKVKLEVELGREKDCNRVRKAFSKTFTFFFFIQFKKLWLVGLFGIFLRPGVVVSLCTTVMLLMSLLS